MVVKNRPDKEMLYKLYVVDNLSAIDIAKIYKCNQSTVIRWLMKDGHKHKLCACGCGEYAKLGRKFIYGHNACEKKGIILTSEHKKKMCGPRLCMNGKNNPNYSGGKVTLICKQCGDEYTCFKSTGETSYFCNRKCYDKWQSENKSGENNPNWKGGISFDPYCEKFNEVKKKEVRDRYDNCDYLTGIYRDICNMVGGKVQELSVHHVDYDKMQGCDDIKWKLIPVSKRHNTMFNKNRPFWKKLILYSLEYDKEYYND